MRGTSTLDYLKDLCERLDVEGDLIRLRKKGTKVAVLLTIPIATLSTNCFYSVEAYGVPFPEEETDCTDGIDNDYDNLIDCDDDDCRSVEACVSCFDDIDNNNDGLADCSDEDCAETEACLGRCDNDVDEDNDNLTDCFDPDCTGRDGCS